MELQKRRQDHDSRKQVVTVLFTDIRGFSGLSERMTVDELSRCSICIIFHPWTISSSNIMAPWINISETAIGDLWGACSVGDDDMRQSQALCGCGRNGIINEGRAGI